MTSSLVLFGHHLVYNKLGNPKYPVSSLIPGLLHVSALGVNLTVAAGLDKDPEISLLTLNVSEGCIKHGLIAKNSLPDQLHFNPNLSGLSVLVTTNSYCDRAWPHKLESDALLRMTAKILLDSVNNLKSIQLAFQIVQMGLCVAEPSEGQDWINAIADFFTVQELFRHFIAQNSAWGGAAILSSNQYIDKSIYYQ